MKVVLARSSRGGESGGPGRGRGPGLVRGGGGVLGARRRLRARERLCRGPRSLTSCREPLRHDPGMLPGPSFGKDGSEVVGWCGSGRRQRADLRRRGGGDPLAELLPCGRSEFVEAAEVTTGRL